MRFALYGLSALAMFAASSPASSATISGTYYEDSLRVVCSNNAVCRITFPLVSAISGKLLIVESVACLGQLNQPLAYGLLTITDNGANERRSHALSMLGTTAGTGYSWHEAIKYKVAGGPPREVNISMGAVTVATTWISTCTIVGTIATE